MPESMVLRALIVVGISAFGISSRADLGACVLRFPTPGQAIGDGTNTGSWLGADSQSSAVLGENRVLWTFGDTFIGPAGTASRKLARPEYYPPQAGQPAYNPVAYVLGNTIGIGSCRDGVYTITYYFRGTAANPRPFFEDPAARILSSRFWAARAFTHAGKLFVFLIRVRNKHDQPGQSTILSTHIARISNPQDDPRSWRIDHLDLVEAGDLFYGNEVVKLDGDLYVYGKFMGPASFPTTVLRLPLDRLADVEAGPRIRDHARFLTKSGAWRPGIIDGDFKDVEIPMGSYFSVRFHRGLGKWLAVYIDNAAADPQRRVLAKVSAAGPFGPWEPPRLIFEFPEMTPGNPLYHADNHCYGISEEEEHMIDPDRYILFAYTCDDKPNPLGPRILDSLDLYYPKVVVVPNPFFP